MQSRDRMDCQPEHCQQLPSQLFLFFMQCTMHHRHFQQHRHTFILSWHRLRIEFTGVFTSQR